MYSLDNSDWNTRVTLSARPTEALNTVLLQNAIRFDKTVGNFEIFLSNGQTYNFSGMNSTTVNNAMLIVPSFSEVTVTGTTLGWAASATGVSLFLQGEDETSWLHLPHFNLTNSDVNRRFWDAHDYGTSHWCIPFSHNIENIVVFNEGQLRAALASTRPTKDTIILHGDIMLVDEREYNFAGIRAFVSAPVSFSIKGSAYAVYESIGGMLIIPSGAEVAVTETPLNWGWGASGTGIAVFLKGEDETAWLHRPGFTASLDTDRRFWDAFAANPHWCAPYSHNITTISVKNEGQLRAALASQAASKTTIVLLNDIELVNGHVYNFAFYPSIGGTRTLKDITEFITAQGTYSIFGSDKAVYVSGGGMLIVPANSQITIYAKDSDDFPFIRGENDSTIVLQRVHVIQIQGANVFTPIVGDVTTFTWDGLEWVAAVSTSSATFADEIIYCGEENESENEPCPMYDSDEEI
jgi:hypothetical protein